MSIKFKILEIVTFIEREYREHVNIRKEGKDRERNKKENQSKKRGIKEK